MYLASLAAAALAVVTLQAASAQELGHGMSDGMPYEGYPSESVQHDFYDPNPRPVRYRDPVPAVKLPATGKFKRTEAQALKGEFVQVTTTRKEEKQRFAKGALANDLDDFADYYDDEMKLRPVDMDGGAGIEYRVFFGATKKPQ